jgi:cytochrome P450
MRPLRTFLYLAQNPEVQEKLYNEVYSVLKGRDPTFEDLPNLKYALWTFKETLRLAPAVQAIPKTTIKEIELDGLKFPVGTNFMVYTPAVHRNPDVWKNPEEFMPERFEKYQAESFLPFSFGPRICLGWRFSETEGQVAICMLAQKYKFRLNPDIKVEDYMKEFSSITTKPYYGHPIIVEKRK